MPEKLITEEIKEIKCPYCGAVQQDQISPTVDNQTDGELCCDACGKYFLWNATFEAKFSTFQK